MMQQQSLTEWQKGGAATVGQEAEGADANKATGQHMQQEAAQELWGRERHHSFLIALGIILPAEGNSLAIEGHEAMVGDGDAVSVAGEIAKDIMRTAEGWFGIDDPVLTEQGAQESAEGFLVL